MWVNLLISCNRVQISIRNKHMLCNSLVFLIFKLKSIAVNVVGVIVCKTKYLNKTQQMMKKLIEHDHTYHKQKSL